MSEPRLLIVVPCLNEEEHLPALLDVLCADPGAREARIVVADGGSTDRSIEIVEGRAKHDHRIVLLSNHRRIQSAGINLAVNRYGADADMLIRIDAHAAYPPDYVSQLIAAQRSSGADSVTVSMRAVARANGGFQEAVAAAQNSALGTGGSPHRKSGERRWVRHGHHALFTMSAFRSVGGYDESFSHNEDAELDARLVGAGKRILLAADVVIDYFPRATVNALARQYYGYGRGRARTARKHGGLQVRQAAPACVAPALLLAALAPLFWWAAAPAASWLLLCLGYGVLLGLRSGSVGAMASGGAAAVMHLAWSVGFLRESVANLWRDAASSVQETSEA